MRRWTPTMRAIAGTAGLSRGVWGHGGRPPQDAGDPVRRDGHARHGRGLTLIEALPEWVEDEGDLLEAMLILKQGAEACQGGNAEAEVAMLGMMWKELGRERPEHQVWMTPVRNGGAAGAPSKAAMPSEIHVLVSRGSMMASTHTSRGVVGRDLLGVPLFDVVLRVASRSGEICSPAFGGGRLRSGAALQPLGAAHDGEFGGRPSDHELGIVGLAAQP